MTGNTPVAGGLAQYKEMRDFTRTPEPPPGTISRTGPLTFTNGPLEADCFSWRRKADGGVAEGTSKAPPVHQDHRQDRTPPVCADRAHAGRRLGASGRGNVCQQVLRAHPDVVTTEWAIEARRGKVFLDYNMNRRSASLAAPYSPRAVAWAGVSTPLGWDELDNAYPAQYHIPNVPERLARMGDLWQHILDARVDLRRLLGSHAA